MGSSDSSPLGILIALPILAGVVWFAWMVIRGLVRGFRDEPAVDKGVTESSSRLDATTAHSEDEGYRKTRRTGLERFFHNEKETLTAVLGQGYVTSLIQGALREGVLFLSDKRLYQEGKVFHRTGSGQFISQKGSSTVSVKDITGVEFLENNRPALLGFAIIFVVAAILVPAINTDLVPISAGLVVFSLIMFGVYFASRKRFFIVKFAGGEIAVDCRWYSENEMRAFQRSISQLKDR